MAPTIQQQHQKLGDPVRQKIEKVVWIEGGYNQDRLRPAMMVRE